MAVATSQLPELKRDGDDDDDLDYADNRQRKRAGLPLRKRPKASKAHKAKVKPKPKIKAKATREGEPFHVEVREAEFERKGSRYLVVLLREGPGSSGWYSREALAKAVENRTFEGKQCFANHPSRSEEAERPERDIHQLIGAFSDARLMEDGGRAAVQAVFTPIRGEGYEWVKTLCENALATPGLCGLSIDGNGITEGEREVDGKRLPIIREMRISSIDLVTRPGVAGAGFVRRLQEAWRDAWADADDPPELPLGLREAAQRADEAEAQLANTERKLKRQRRKRRLAEASAERVGAEFARFRELAERDGFGRIEGVPRRDQGGIPAYNGHGAGDLLSRMGIDRSELELETNR